MREKLIKTFKKSFPNVNFNDKDFDSYEVDSIAEWDSIANLNFLMNIESDFNIRLSSDELSETKSIKAILKILNN
tara:strand:+ start:1244 stop:1468 length:225 start_codon:yes stop_codon:yes gene_type:complete